MNDRLPVEALTQFGKRLEEIVKESLRQAGIPFHHVEYHPTSDGETALEVVSFFTPDLEPMEKLLLQIFSPDRERTVTIGDRRRKGEQLPGTYLVYLDPVRKELPEWKAFAHEPVLILLSSLFQGALFSLMGFFSGQGFPDDPEIHREIDRFSAMVTELDAGFASLYERQSAERGEDAPSASAETGEEPSRAPEESLTPEGLPQARGEKPLDAASLRLFLTVGTPIPSMCAEVAREGELQVLPDDGSAEELARLFEFLQSRNIGNYGAMEHFFREQLGSWDRIYEALELARVRDLLKSSSVKLYTLILVLLQARAETLHDPV